VAPRAGRGKRVYTGIHVTVHFDLDRQGIKLLAVSPQVGDGVEDFVKTKLKPYARSISPRSRRNEAGHIHYQDAFETDRVITGAPPAAEIIGRPPMRRVGVRLLNVAPHAAAVEFGNRGRKSHRVLGKTLARFNRPFRDPF
jgi:hypothetical protein